MAKSWQNHGKIMAKSWQSETVWKFEAVSSLPGNQLGTCPRQRQCWPLPALGSAA